MKRKVLLEPSAETFLLIYEARLMRQGFSEPQVQVIAALLIDILMTRLPRGGLSVHPNYVGVDQDRPGYSVYKFSEGPIDGQYSCNGDVVIVEVLSFNVLVQAITDDEGRYAISA